MTSVAEHCYCDCGSCPYCSLHEVATAEIQELLAEILRLHEIRVKEHEEHGEKLCRLSKEVDDFRTQIVAALEGK